MPVTRILVFVFLGCMAARPAAAAASCEPIAPGRIEQMWRLYSGASGIVPNGGGDGYECVADEQSLKLICRTKLVNPAHPSIVIRTVTQKAGKMFLKTEGDTAADCGAFLDMMRQFEELDRGTMQNLVN